MASAPPTLWADRPLLTDVKGVTNCFYQWATDSISIVLHHSVIDSNLTDINQNENCWDYHFNTHMNHYLDKDEMMQGNTCEEAAVHVLYS